MRIKLVFIVSLWFIIISVGAQEQIRVSWTTRDMTFEEFISDAEELYGVRFFYSDEWTKNISPSIMEGNYTLSELLVKALSGTSVYYYIDDKNNVILTLNFAIRDTRKPAVIDESRFVPSMDYSNDQDDSKFTGNLFVDIGNPADRNKPGGVAVTGYITDRDTKQPVSGVTVYVLRESAGTISNEYGYYSITLPRGSHLLQFTFIGMKEKQVNVNLNSSGEMNIEMNSILIPIKETVISAEKNVMFQRFEVGVEKINISSFKLLPSPMGEADIFKSVLLIPGVQSVGEGSSGFNVRGGSSDQNLILLYGAPVYNASHFFGFFSAVNSEIIKDVTLYKGGIPSRYGGRISSIMDIVSKDGNRKEFTGKAGISPLTTQLLVEGPVIKDKLTYMLAGRTTYSNWVMHLFDNPTLRNSSASFYDLNGRVTLDINTNNKIDFSTYNSHDSFKFNTDTSYSYNNNIYALKWRHFFNSHLFSVFSVSNSKYDYDISSIRNQKDAFVLSHSINSTGLKADFNWYQGRNEINFGTDHTRYSVLPGSYLPQGDSSLVKPVTIGMENSLESGVYIDDKFIVNDYFSINAGLRFSAYFTSGPKEVLIYEPSFPRSTSTVIDTMYFASNDVYQTYGGPEIRLSLNFRISSKSSLKINYNRTRQYIHLLTNSTSISPSDTWKLSDYYLKPESGDQYAAGFYQSLFKGIEASAEIYYKRIRNVVDYKAGTRLVMNSTIEKDLVAVEGKSYGIEMMVKKQEGRFLWSLGYTYSRALLRSTGKMSDEIINEGEWFPANYDKPNDITATFNYLFSRRMSFSANYTYSTGRPITYPVATYSVRNQMLIHYSDRNKYRLPDYSRLDLALRYNGNLKSRRIAHPSWTFSVYNILGRENVYSVYFRKEGNVINGYKLSVFAKAIPSITYSFDF
ncbi:MAG TPA: TonB-dependent receptor [Bacteroidales bacterium]|nr:TonB-dependent receptor [Bacteroidales bacterium]HBH83880.1 TonB-dependent receptor [Bacteroidales bacterium]HBQ83953.1 TonB-dependent receptor [Bacteroidales bacterium]HCU20291.1 TonB-dependent receptor [Bacteroidales bacterium]